MQTSICKVATCTIKCEIRYLTLPNMQKYLALLIKNVLLIAKQGALSQTACRNACTNNRDPMKSSFSLQACIFLFKIEIN